MSRHVGISASSVQRIWSKNDLKPHRLKTFKLSSDPKFEEKFWDVIGLYLNPPVNALVLYCDEKSQCQALERTQLGLPLAPKRPPTMTHDYIRHGTITLFAALIQLTGKLITRTEARHTYVEWLRFSSRSISRQSNRFNLRNRATSRIPDAIAALGPPPPSPRRPSSPVVLAIQFGCTSQTGSPETCSAYHAMIVHAGISDRNGYRCDQLEWSTSGRDAEQAVAQRRG
jgi:hypothetical protein